MMKQGVRLETLVTFLLLCLSLSGWHSCRQLLGVLPEQLKEALHTSPVAVHLAVGLLHQAADVVIRHCQLKAPCKQKGHLQAATNGPQMMTSIMMSDNCHSWMQLAKGGPYMYQVHLLSLHSEHATSNGKMKCSLSPRLHFSPYTSNIRTEVRHHQPE